LYSEYSDIDMWIFFCHSAKIMLFL
jgi:hypothetical protein